MTGYSPRRARLPAALFASASVFAVAVLAAQLGLKHAWAAGLIFAAFPMTVRYAAESRVYSQALFFSILATILYVRLSRKQDWPAAALYSIALTAAAYTQPYAASIGLAHVAWSMACRERKTAIVGGTAVVLAGLAFLPWYLFAKAGWAASVLPNALHFSASMKTPLMLFRELAGAGYWGSGLLLILCALAAAGPSLTRRTTTLMVSMIVLPAISMFAADAIFDYFLAARQFMWVLPAVALLAAAAFERPTRTRVVLGGLLGAVCVWQNIRYVTGPHEDWHKAAVAMSDYVRQGACIAVAPPEHSRFYEFFESSLRHGRCMAPRMLLAITPYATAAEREQAIAALTAEGYEPEGEVVVGQSVLVRFFRER
jgi:hypothetical protein